MRAIVNKITTWLSAWHQRYMGDIPFLLIVAVGIGLCCGIAAGLLKGGVDLVTRLIFSTFNIHSVNYQFLMLPILGILIATAFTVYIIRHPMDHASDRLAEGMAKGQNSISARLIWGPIVGCSITLGMGGSAGAEDPIVYTGGAIGSNVGKAFKLGQEDLEQLVGCGAAAAIAGIFMAPVGGVMFALEVLKMKQNLQTVLAIIFASLVSALTCYIMLGCHTDVTFMPEMRFELSLMPLVIACGLFCGLYSVYYSLMMSKCRKLFLKVNNIWYRALIGGVILAVMLFFFPSLYGEGYHIIGKLMADDPNSIISYSPLYKLGADYGLLLLMMAIVLLLKPFATSSTNDSGGVGGDFTPTFYCGGIAGFLFAGILNHYFGMDISYALFAFFGMSAVMAGAIRAPLMAIFISAEMTGLYGFILPLTVAAVSSFLTALLLSKIHVPLPFLQHKNVPQS